MRLPWQLFEVEGLELVIQRVRMNERSLRAIENGEVPIHADFREFNPDELAADYMWVVAQHREVTGVLPKKWSMCYESL